MKRFLMAIALSCVLSASTLAGDGDVPTVGVTAPPPDETTSTTSTTAPGDVSSSGGFTPVVTETALTLIQSILGAVV